MKTPILALSIFIFWLAAHVGATGLHINALYRIG